MVVCLLQLKYAALLIWLAPHSFTKGVQQKQQQLTEQMKFNSYGKVKLKCKNTISSVYVVLAFLSTESR